jgi:hypothetical protein
VKETAAVARTPGNEELPAAWEAEMFIGIGTIIGILIILLILHLVGAF